jgi:GT2 family glycosyltransferase
MKEPKVSVVMLSYNRKDDVMEGVGELLAQDYKNIEIIIVDNGSGDKPGVKPVALDKNIGVAAYNIGFRRAEGEYIVILDDDSFPEQTAIRQMVEQFEKDPELGVVAFDVRNYYDYKKIVKKEETDTGKKERGEKQTGKSRYQMAFNGAGVGIRTRCIREVGGYPEEFFLYWNEQDLSIRILDAGYGIRWFPGIVSLHKYSPANRESWRAPFYYTRNLYWLIWKYFPLKKVLKDTIQLVYYSFYYSMEQRTIIYLKATASAFFGLGKLKRKPVKKEIVKNLRLTYRLAFIYYK